MATVRPPEFVKHSATKTVPAVVPTVAKSVGEARLPGIAKYSATTVFERTAFNSVLLSTTVVPSLPVDLPRQFLIAGVAGLFEQFEHFVLSSE